MMKNAVIAVAVRITSNCFILNMHPCWLMSSTAHLWTEMQVPQWGMETIRKCGL